MKPIDPRDYVPILKWRQGEYQALFRLDDAIKDRVIPIIEVPPVEWDFELRRHAKTIDEHLEPFGKRVHTKWGNRFGFLDVHLLEPTIRLRDGSHPLLSLGNDSRRHGARLIPIVRLNSTDDHLEAAREFAFVDRWGACLRLDLDDLLDTDLDASIASLVRRLEVDVGELDIVIDLGAPNFEPFEEFTELVWALTSGVPILEQARSFILAGTAFPESLASLSDSIQVVPRLEWQLYREVRSKLRGNQRIPTFGDYAIAHPVLAEGDMRLMKPSANIRYTLKDTWCVIKGRNVRDYGFEQYHGHCRQLIERGFFAGPGYSAGDKFIEDCAFRDGSTGNLSTWRWVGTNHHLTRVVSDLANFPGS